MPRTGGDTTWPSSRSTAFPRARPTSWPRSCGPKPGRLSDAAAYAKALAAADAPREDARLNDFDVVFLRNNPNVGAAEGDAFNPALEFGRRLKQLGVLVVNDPDGLARAGSKMYLAGFPAEIRPKTLITRSVERVRAFLRELDGPAIIKPLSGFGGQNVFYVARGQSANLEQMISTVRREGYVIVQEYLPAVAKGDKRVLLLGGRADARGRRRRRLQAHAAQGRHPQQHARGRLAPARRVPEAERRICDLLRPRLVADGLYFVGVDLVGDKILEINVFAPGGIHNINELYGVDVATAVIRDLERKVELRSVYREPLPPHVIMRA